MRIDSFSPWPTRTSHSFVMKQTQLISSGNLISQTSCLSPFQILTNPSSPPVTNIILPFTHKQSTEAILLSCSFVRSQFRMKRCRLLALHSMRALSPEANMTSSLLPVRMIDWTCLWRLKMWKAEILSSPFEKPQMTITCSLSEDKKWPGWCSSAMCFTASQ